MNFKASGSNTPVLLGLAVIMFSLAIMAGCAAGPMKKRSGFLQDYDRMIQDPNDQSVMYWALDGVDWKKYKRVMIDPVEVRIDPKKAERELQPAEIKKLAGDFRRIALKSLKGFYPVVGNPAPDVMRVRVALTHLVPVLPAANVTSVALLGMPLDLGEAGIEVRFSDSLSGRLLAEMTDFKKGRPFRLDQGWTRWSHVEDAFEQWAEEFKKSLDEMHGVKTR